METYKIHSHRTLVVEWNIKYQIRRGYFCLPLAQTLLCFTSQLVYDVNEVFFGSKDYSKYCQLYSSIQ